MKLLEVVTPLSAIYHDCSSQKRLWEENSTPVNMTSCVRRNIRKHKEVKEIEQYIALETSFERDCMYKREFIYSESCDYMGIAGKEMNNYLALRTKRLNKKQKARISITDITNQYFRRFLKSFNNLPYLGYKR